MKTLLENDKEDYSNIFIQHWKTQSTNAHCVQKMWFPNYTKLHKWLASSPNFGYFLANRGNKVAYINLKHRIFHFLSKYGSCPLFSRKDQFSNRFFLYIILIWILRSNSLFEDAAQETRKRWKPWLKKRIGKKRIGKKRTGKKRKKSGKIEVFLVHPLFPFSRCAQMSLDLFCAWGEQRTYSLFFNVSLFSSNSLFLRIFCFLV